MLSRNTLAFCLSSAVLTAAQSPSAYTDAATGAQLQAIKLTQNVNGGFQFGVAFPQTLGADDYIGNIIGARVNGAGWSGVTHSGGMLNSLILVAWADGNDIKTSFRIASGYRSPVIYADSASVKLTPLSKSVNATHYSLVYRCQGCFNWNFNGKHYNQSLTGDAVNFGWAQSTKPVKTPSYPSSPIQFHDNGFGEISFAPKAAALANFDALAAKVSGSTTAPKSPKIAKRFPQVAAAANGTTTLPAIAATPSPALGTAQPKIPVPVSSASAPIPSLAGPAPKGALPTPPAPGAATLPKLPLPKLLPRPRPFPKGPPYPLPKGKLPKGPKGTGTLPRLPKGTGSVPRPRPIPKGVVAPVKGVQTTLSTAVAAASGVAGAAVGAIV